MIQALNMQLEPVRTVLANEVNAVAVCEDCRRDTGVFYTVISITAPEVRREVAGLMATARLFVGNRDFIGSFTQGDALNLVFLYRTENRLLSHEDVYGTDFPHRREMAENFLTACAETQLEGSVGMLLLEERNLNLGRDGSVYFNYFLDFARWERETSPERFYSVVAVRAFDILSRDYTRQAEGSITNYPSELQVLYKKAQFGSFISLGGVLACVRALPARLSPPSRGLRRLWAAVLRGLHFLQRHSMEFFLGILVTVTLVYLVVQVSARVSAQKAADNNIVFQGLAQIGEVYLGDEDG